MHSSLLQKVMQIDIQLEFVAVLNEEQAVVSIKFVEVET
jgi:hypothetical protein